MTTSTWKSSVRLAAGTLGAYAVWRAAMAWSRRYEFQNKIIVITGGSRGLGLILARKFAAEGARLAIVARDAEELAQAREELARCGATVLTVICDLTRAFDVADCFATIRRELGPIDVLVNNAGIIQVGPLDTLTLDDFVQAMATHFWAALHATREVLPDMRRRGHGRIVNIASIGGEIAVPHLLPYSASKFALVGLSDGLRSELTQEGIYVTTVCPGMMRTGSPRHAMFKGQHRAEFAWFSILGSLPFITISAERAARQIVSACRYGRAKVTISLPAKIAVRVAAMAPDLTADIASLMNRVLPVAGGIGKASAPGAESTSEWSPSPLTMLSDQAAERNNEMLPPT